MLRYLPLLAALAGCAAPDTFVLAAIATGDAAPTDVSSDAVGDAPADTARPDVAIADASDAAATDAADATDATDAQVADVASDTAQPDAPADVALADASDATGDAAVSDVADASADAIGDAGDAPEASVDEICARATDCAACTAIRFDAAYGCGWCGGNGRCLYGRWQSQLHGSCFSGWAWGAETCR